VHNPGMRLPRLLVVPLVAVLAAACGGAQTLSTVEVIRAAATTTSQQKTSKMEFGSTTTLGTQRVTLTGVGAFDYTSRNGSMTVEIPGAGGGQLLERVVNGVAYIQLPTAKDTFYSLKLADIAGTSFGASTDPTSSLQGLQGVSSDVRKVGSEKVRGVSTTHYKGTYDVRAALAKLTGPTKDALSRALGSSNVSAVPFEAYIDKQRRLRRFVQQFAVTQTGGLKVTTLTTLDLYEFGTPINVTAPPASQVKDGAPLLDALKSVGGAPTG
jgi:hypothetical protein